MGRSGEIGVWAWLPALLLFTLNVRWDLTETASASLDLAPFLPLFAGWLASRHGRSALGPVLAVALIGAAYLDWRIGAVAIALGAGPAIGALSYAAAGAFAGEPSRGPVRGAMTQALLVFGAFILLSFSFRAGFTPSRSLAATFELNAAWDLPALAFLVAVSARTSMAALIAAVLALVLLVKVAALSFSSAHELLPSLAHSSRSEDGRILIEFDAAWRHFAIYALLSAAAMAAGALIRPFWTSHGESRRSRFAAVALFLAVPVLLYAAFSGDAIARSLAALIPSLPAPPAALAAAPDTAAIIVSGTPVAPTFSVGTVPHLILGCASFGLALAVPRWGALVAPVAALALYVVTPLIAFEGALSAEDGVVLFQDLFSVALVTFVYAWIGGRVAQKDEPFGVTETRHAH